MYNLIKVSQGKLIKKTNQNTLERPFNRVRNSISPRDSNNKNSQRKINETYNLEKNMIDFKVFLTRI